LKIGDTAIDYLVDFCLIQIYELCLGFGVKSEPYFSKIPHQLLFFVFMVLILGWVVSVWSFRGLRCSIADGMLEAPDSLLISHDPISLNLTGIQQDGFQVKDGVSEVEHHFDGVFGCEAFYFDILCAFLAHEINRVNIGFVGFIKQLLNIFIKALELHFGQFQNVSTQELIIIKFN
jgi:hypothetical protein